MAYRGHIEHGVVVLSEPLALPDGTDVEVSSLPAKSPRQIGAGLSKLAGKAVGLPADLAENHDQYRRELAK